MSLIYYFLEILFSNCTKSQLLEFKHEIYLIMHINVFLNMMDDYRHLKTNVMFFYYG